VSPRAHSEPRWGLNANIHAQNDCAFRYACEKGHIEIAKWLHSSNANIHAQNDYAFRLACNNGQFEVVEWLLNFNIDFSTFGRYFFSTKIMKEMVEIYKIISENDQIIIKEIMNNNFTSIKRLIEDGFDFSFLDHFPFKFACRNNLIELVELLAENFSFYSFSLINDKVEEYNVCTSYPKNARNIKKIENLMD